MVILSGIQEGSWYSQPPKAFAKKKFHKCTQLNIEIIFFTLGSRFPFQSRGKSFSSQSHT